jgi:dethiobiotin synthetase
MTQFFISAIGTEVGKTFCTAAMLHQSSSYRAIKPVISGYERAASSDAGELLRAMGLPVNQENAEAISPFRFKAPLSPHLAAAKENKVIDKDVLEAFCREQCRSHSRLLIEGVGGLMVPITADYLVIDWMKALDLPVILVAGTYLGAINHTLLSLKALEYAGLNLHALLVNQSAQCAGITDFCSTLEPHLPKKAHLIAVPRVNSWQNAPDLLPLLS